MGCHEMIHIDLLYTYLMISYDLLLCIDFWSYMNYYTYSQKYVFKNCDFLFIIYLYYWM